VGKSRLVGELMAEIGDSATALRGRCLHYGEGITFWPLVEALMPVGTQAEAVLESLRSGGAAVPQELFWGVRRLLEALAIQRPVVLHVDDLQWAQPMLLDLLDHVVDLSRGTPILVLCTARPELLEERPGWGGGKLNATTVLLEPLSSDDSETFLSELGDGLDPEARSRVIAGSQGNPLFLEEMVALARERGIVEVPPTIQALLVARLERLGVEERELLERGAVEGEVFHRLAVTALAGERLATEVELRLAGLVRKELIRPHPARFENDEAFRFRHLLIRDAAYDTLPKATRADLHERFAAWLEESGVYLVELDEIAGWHLEQTVRYRRELGQGTDPALARHAAQHLHAAGRRAASRSDVAAASNLLARALALTPEDDPGHAGEFVRAERLAASAEHDPVVGPLAEMTRLNCLSNIRASEALAEIESRLDPLLDQLTKAGDERGIAKAHMIALMRHLFGGQMRRAAEEARLTALHAARAGDEALRIWALGRYAMMLKAGPEHADTIERELDEIERRGHGPYIDALIKLGRGEVARLRGDFDQAREFTQRGISTIEGLGMPAMGGLSLALIEFSAGQPQAGIDSLARADEVLAELGERSFRSTIQAFTAYGYSLLGDRAAALGACELATQLSAPEDVINFAVVSAAQARVAALNGDFEHAEALARRAVQQGSRTDNTSVCVWPQRELAHALAGMGRREEAAAEGRKALELYESKGDRPGIAQSQAFLDQL
jgi:tetratricopeptide (TPR) repeat protein